MQLIEHMKKMIQGKEVRMVFAEGWDERMMRAAVQLKTDALMQPILLGDATVIKETAHRLALDLDACQIIDPQQYDAYDGMVEAFVELRKGKTSEAEAKKLLRSPNYFGTMLIKVGLADGLVGGVLFSTADTVRPALQIIKTKPGVAKVSSMFYMQKADRVFLFADCAINVDPSAADLVDIATGCLTVAPQFGIEKPKIAFLSFSSKGSAKGPQVEKVQQAASQFAAKYPDTLSDGELQFDAAVVPDVGLQKAPASEVAGHANILIFPDLAAGNIGYKIAQRLGGYDALGPILLGLNAPINDLSRGASTEDVYNLAIITAAQAV